MRSHWSYDKLAIEFYKCDTTCYEYSLKNFHPGLRLKQIKKTFMRVLSFVTLTYSGRVTEKLLLPICKIFCNIFWGFELSCAL